jgi:autotransporter translocation and assembly factor TamB
VNLNDTELESRAGTLLTGAGFFPVDPFPVMAGKDWRGAVQGDGKVYLRVATPGGVDLAELARVAGQDYPVAGKLRMEAEIGGTAADLNAKGWMKADGFAVGAGDVPKSVLDLAFEAGGGAADVKGRLETRGSGVVAAAARFPVGFSKNASGAVVLVDPAGKIEASVDFPRADLALLRPFFPKLRSLDGEATGSLKISNTVSEPRIDGSAEIVRAGFRFGILPDEVEVVGGRFVFESDKARLENVSGAIGGGRFEMKGACSFARASEPEFEAAWKFERVPVHDDPGARLFVGGELASAGGLGGGLLGGRIDFVDSRINGSVALDFGLGGARNTAPALGAFAWMVGEMAAGKNWALDVAVGGGPIRLGAEGLRGELLPAMRLRGTAGEPLPTGRIAMSGVSVDAAADGVLFFDGNLDFLADAPWDPFVTASARGWVNGSEAGLFAFGPLSEGRWMPVFAQDGAKPQEVFFLLSQGLVFSAGEGLAPVDFRAYGNRSGVAGMRVARDTAWSRGIRFGESLDMALRGPVMPMESFLVDYSWRLAPEF